MRASSQSTNASNRSDFPPETRNRSRAAATLFGCKASTRRPASSSRSTSSPSGRSIATSPTSIRTSIRHSAVRPFSSCAYVALSSSSPVSSATSTSCVCDAQSIPAYRHAILTLHRRVAFTAPRPGGTVAGAHRQGPRSLGLRPVAACGTSPPSGRAGLWQALHERASNRGPLPAAVEATTACPMSRSRVAIVHLCRAIVERSLSVTGKSCGRRLNTGPSAPVENWAIWRWGGCVRLVLEPRLILWSGEEERVVGVEQWAEIRRLCWLSSARSGRSRGRWGWRATRSPGRWRALAAEVLAVAGGVEGGSVQGVDLRAVAGRSVDPVVAAQRDGDRDGICGRQVDLR